MTEKIDDIDAFFKEQTIGGYTIKPWSLGQVEKLYPVIQQIIEKGREAGISLANFEKSIAEKPEAIGFIVMTFGSIVVSETLGIDIKEAKSIDFGLIIQMLFSIFIMNIGTIKNSLSLIERVKDIVATSVRQ